MPFELVVGWYEVDIPFDTNGGAGEGEVGAEGSFVTSQRTGSCEPKRLADPGPGATGAGCACEVPTADQLRNVLFEFPVIDIASYLRLSNELSILVGLPELELPELEDVSTTRHLSLNSLGRRPTVKGES